LTFLFDILFMYNV